MRRPPHGATARPGPVRPAAGYGRPPGRPGPRAALVLGDRPDDGGQAVISVSASASPDEPGPTPAA
jgi:hypothetical protein